MATSDNQDDAKPLKTDRRVTLDGGLNTRSSCLNVQSNEVTALGNFRLQSGGLQKRMGGAQLCTINPYASTASMPAPILVDGGAASGTLAAGTYTIGYVLGTVSKPGGLIGMSPTSVIVVALNHSIQVLIPGNNNGEGFGRLTANTYIDCPVNGGYQLVQPFLVAFAGQACPGIYVKKTGDPNFTLQTATDLGTEALNVPPLTGGRQFSLTAYSISGFIAPVGSLAPIPVRFLFWYPLIDTLIGVSADTPYALQGALTTPQYLALANDSAGNAFGFSRIPTRITPAVIDKCLILSDGIGRPKIMDSPVGTSQYNLSAPTSWSFRQLGAAAPPAAATRGALVGGALTGTYQYVYTFTYQRNRQDGTSFLSESNSSPALTVTYAAQQTTITIVAPSESGIVSWNLYRTAASGTDFFLDATNPIATLTVSDNLVDASLFRQSPPDKGAGKIFNDIPPTGLAMVTEFSGLGFGALCNPVRRASGGNLFNDLVRTRVTNIAQYSKAKTINDLISTNAVGLGVGGGLNTLPGDFGNIDAWPSTQTFPCGNSSPTTAIVSFRGVLYWFKEDEIGVVEGTIGDFQYRTIWTGSGAMENSIIQIGNYLLAFDQALGPIMISGYSVTNIGYSAVQVDWQNPIVSTLGEAISGGGRGSCGVISKMWDTSNSEARWVISNYQTDPQSGVALGDVPVFFEYVCQVPQEKPSGQFTRFTGCGMISGFSGTAAGTTIAPGIPATGTTLTVAAGLSWVAGQAILIYDPAAPTTHYALGVVTGYAGTSLFYYVTYAVGSLTYANIAFTGATFDRRILSQTQAIVGTAGLPFRARDVVYGDYHGRLVDDTENEFDLNGVVNVPITMRATFPFFFGDDPEKVKQFRYLYAMTTMGALATDVMNIITQSLSKDVTAPLSMTSIPGGQAPAGINRLQHIPFLPTLDGTTSKDRGAQILISGSAASGPTSLQELTVKYQDAGYRSKP